MLFWSRTRQWKRSADEALAADHSASQRELLAKEVCSRVAAIQVLQGIGAGEEASQLVRQVALHTLDETMVRSSLGLRYLDALDESLRHASYEDAVRLLAEARWAKDYIGLKAPCPLEAAISSQGGDRFWEPKGRLDRLFYALTLLTVAELAGNELAA